MRINLPVYFACALISGLFLLGLENLNAQSDKRGIKFQNEKDGPAVILSYKDTLKLDSFTDFDLQVKMKTGYEISAVSLGLYYPTEYLEIDSVFLADNAQGFYYSDTNGLIIIAWSDVNPITIPDEGTLITLKMNTLDLKDLIGTIKLGLYESSEFADQSANVIEGVELEVPEIEYYAPIDTIPEERHALFRPNPFYDHATVSLYLETDSKVTISLCDLRGMEIFRTEEKYYKPGNQYIGMNALGLSNAVYLLKIEIKNSKGTSTKLVKVVAMSGTVGR